MLFGPKRKPDSSKYILWNDSVYSIYSSCYLHGLFNFDSYLDIIIVKQQIALTH